MNNPHENVYSEIEWIGKNGFDFVDLTLEPTAALYYQIDVQRIKRLIKKYNLGVVGHMGDWRLPKDSPFPALREASKIEIINAMRTLAKIGAKKITTHSFKLKESDYDTAEKYCFDLYKDLLKEAKKLNVTLMLENGATSYAYNPDNRRLLANTLKKFPNLKVHVDVGHTNIGVKKNIVGLFFKKYGKRIVHLHLADNYGKNDNHLKLGVGTINWKKTIKTLKKYGYDGTMTVETFASGKSGTLESKEKIKRWWATY